MGHDLRCDACSVVRHRERDAAEGRPRFDDYVRTAVAKRVA
jgi:hypothetical protein